jgi:hypothetical protein
LYDARLDYPPVVAIVGQQGARRAWRQAARQGTLALAAGPLRLPAALPSLRPHARRMAAGGERKRPGANMPASAVIRDLVNSIDSSRVAHLRTQ